MMTSLTRTERTYLWVAGMTGAIILQTRLVNAWLTRAEKRYYERVWAGKRS